MHVEDTNMGIKKNVPVLIAKSKCYLLYLYFVTKTKGVF